MFKFSIIGGTKLQGKFKPDQKNTYTTLVGDHKIDLREADLSSDKPVKFTMCALVCNARVIVQPSTRIDVGGVVLIGNKKTSVESGTEPSGAPVKVRSNSLIGNLEVTSKD